MKWPLRPLLVASVLRQRLCGDRGEAVGYVVRLTPAAWRATAARAVLSVPAAPLAVRAIAEFASGDRNAAIRSLLAGRPTPRRLPFRTSLALAMGAPDTARQLLARLPTDNRARPRLVALLDWYEGEQDAALSVLSTGAVTGAEGRRSAALRRRFEAELRILQPSWRPMPIRPPRRSGAAPERVLHLLTNSLPATRAGYTIRSHHILTAQRMAGLDAHAVTRLGYPSTAGVLRAPPVEVVAGVPYHRLLPWRGLPRHADEALALGVEMVGALVEDIRPAVLHPATNHVNAQIALSLRERYGLPVVYEVRGFLEESWVSRSGADGTDSDRYRRSRSLETYCMQQADLIVTLGAVMKADIVARGVPADRVIVVPNAVSDSFLRDRPDPATVRRGLSLRPGEWLVGLVSTFAAHEGIETLVRAVALLRSAGVPVRLLLVGDGPESPALRRLAAELGIADAVSMPGWVPYAEVGQWYAALDVFVVPRTDARVSHLVTPLKPIEAMALARPVLASNVGGLAEIIQPGITGVLVPPEDPVALAIAMENLLRDEPARLAMGAAGRDWVAGERSWSRNANRYRVAYAKLALTLSDPK